jgi:hypothetical protein
MGAFRYLLVLAGGLLLAGCTAGLTDPWSGEWQGANGQKLRFTSDGKVELYADGVKRATGTYTRLGGTAVQVNLTMTEVGPSGTKQSRMSIVKLDDTGKSLEFNRARYRKRK